MKFLAALAVIIIVCFFVKYFSGDTYSLEFKNAVEKQSTAFVVPNEKAIKVWNRAPEYLQNMKHLITGGVMQQNDTMVYIPYLPRLSFNKGNSIRVKRCVNKDSTDFFIEWFDYGMPDTFAAKEMAFYMLYGIDRYAK